MNNLTFGVCLFFLALNCQLSRANYETYGRAIEMNQPRGLTNQNYPNSMYGTYGSARNAPSEIDVKIIGSDYNTARRNRRMTDEMQPNQMRS